MLYVGHEMIPHPMAILPYHFLPNRTQLNEGSLISKNGFSQQFGNIGFDPLKVWPDFVVFGLQADHGIFRQGVSGQLFHHMASDSGQTVQGVLVRSNKFIWNNSSVSSSLGNKSTFFTANSPAWLWVKDVRNGKPGILPQGSDRIAGSATISPAITTGPFEIFTVLRRGSTTGSHVGPWSWGLAVGGNAPELLVCDATLDVCNLRNDVGGPTERRFNTTLIAGNDYILNVSQSGLAGGTGLWINGIKEANTFNAVNWSGNTSTMSIGQTAVGASIVTYDSYIFEVWLFKKFFNEVERAAMYGYLSAKYAI